MTVHTAIALRTCIRFTRLVLTGRFVTVWTLDHLSILAHPFRHSLKRLRPELVEEVRAAWQNSPSNAPRVPAVIYFVLEL